jgi:hypothetical protein
MYRGEMLMKNLVVFIFLVWGGIVLVFGVPQNKVITLVDSRSTEIELSEASEDAYGDYTADAETSDPREIAETDTPETTESTEPVEPVTEEKTGGQVTLYQFTSDYYRIYSDVSEETAKLISVKMEAALKLYNSIFHFDLSKLSVKLKVKIYNNIDNFNSYIRKFVTEKKNDFIYIHYSDLGKCELVGFTKSAMADFNQSLLHQGFIQFIKAFVANPPLWLQEGMAGNT